MWEYMLAMIHAGMLTKDDLAQFSDELQRELAHVFDGK
jgi:hypothetical protein